MGKRSKLKSEHWLLPDQRRQNIRSVMEQKESKPITNWPIFKLTDIGQNVVLMTVKTSWACLVIK
jgi:hypothetical protein